MAKRGERVAPPPRASEWELRHTGDSAAGWEELCKQAPGPTREAFERLSRDPCDRSNPKRQHLLGGDYGKRMIGGTELPQWQYEVTGGGRIWYCPDAARRIVHLTRASCGHPKETD